MEQNRKIKLLEKLLVTIDDLKKRGCIDPIFTSWKSDVVRTYLKVFGEDSYEVRGFNNLKFHFSPMYYFSGDDYSMEDRRVYAESLELTAINIKKYIEELKEEQEYLSSCIQIKEISKGANSIYENINKIFISHASKDKDLVEDLIDLLETIGLKPHQIFCSSFEGYGIELGEDFLERIKSELSNDVLVLFVLSENFYNSPVCLCEMGATWIKTNNHIPILIPPFKFEDVKGVIPMTQGFKINDEQKVNAFMQKITKLFSLSESNDFSTWERKRDRIINRINDKINL